MRRRLIPSVLFGKQVDSGVSSRGTWTDISSRLLPEPNGELTLCHNCTQLCDYTIRQVGAIYSLRSADLDDFIQDAWLTVLNAVAGGRFNPSRGRLIDWLFVMARNRATTFFRQQTRNYGTNVPLDQLPGRFCEDPAKLVQRSCDIEQVRQALTILQQRVSPLCYSAFHRRRMQQQSVGEIAAMLHLTREQVRAYDFRARRKLAAIMTYCERI